ncbi:hypothetical protein Dacet_1552 [Denitrovibrio acetiphilus DSM 12809]|uniref:Uncharacterized protein n=1 Tax=Denitrovibrio acetiphilus (strain DSM 12809 / NBRC 114555 / N2460) TaxID=522772 RepID=D4H8H2_DENA2|nr:hypothetical protein [Denitrovibrio acetiphilus]ADD68321.1 hypothetical protein Dacet_1552 [Denitrovibrio acetiphilus DSM 12809]
MDHKLINVSEKSNIEINDSSIEMLFHGVCLSYECPHFRANKCRMMFVIHETENSAWKYSQTWMTPTKFFLHMLKHGDNASDDALELFKQLQEKWHCLDSDASCNCDFVDEIKALRNALLKDLDY